MSALPRSLREALALIAERTNERNRDPGVMVSDATFSDNYNAFINWRTAQALHRRGLVTHPYIGSGYDGDNTSVALTPAGWAALGLPAGGGRDA
jgi:hypothetical protein